ncbi:PREDICTED: uncharacterized protein LOC105451280 [Wasmannia auropunctata]|uniref:uncharacterized protein LOC105451280 n=1 Tax=Wasmannia auropunctata TaxID=64793 RepID=UPI0005EE8ED7|nr:PREDICTED: uncharacterized protein LOC105451280 [Wasmannia auropunctata]
MAERIRVVVQKRTALKAQITGLTNMLEKERQSRFDKAALKLRMARVTELYHAYEELQDELELLDPSEGHKHEFANVQERFYALAGRIEELTNPAESVAIAGPSTARDAYPSVDASTAAAVKRKTRLPEVSLPNFDGRYENWLSFKNAFIAMIDSRRDISDVEKLQYLRTALTGEAANKIKILTIESANYSKAWELLKRAYEVKRILISRHLSLLRNLPVLERETTEGLSKLADDTQQHVASLASLGVDVNSEMIVNVLESKLPKNTAEKWEESLMLDEFPKIDDLYEFLYRTAVRVSKRTRPEALKRDDEKNSPSVKRGRFPNKAFVVNTKYNCVACKNGQHPLFKCGKFKQFDVSKRMEVVKNARLCYNCMRSHRGKPCTYTGCTICNKRHNTLLHSDKFPTATLKTDATDSKAEGSA